MSLGILTKSQFSMKIPKYFVSPKKICQTLHSKIDTKILLTFIFLFYCPVFKVFFFLLFSLPTPLLAFHFILAWALLLLVWNLEISVLSWDISGCAKKWFYMLIRKEKCFFPRNAVALLPLCTISTHTSHLFHFPP